MTLALLEPLLFLAAAGSAAAGLLILQLGLQRVFSVAPRLKPGQDVAAPDTSLTVVIPAFNEAHNIEACVASVLANQPPAGTGRCWWWMTSPAMQRWTTPSGLALQRPTSG